MALSEGEVSLDGLIIDRAAKGTGEKALQHRAGEVFVRLAFLPRAGDLFPQGGACEISGAWHEFRRAFDGEAVQLQRGAALVVEVAERVGEIEGAVVAVRQLEKGLRHVRLHGGLAEVELGIGPIL